jgi:hypothetical protein
MAQIELLQEVQIFSSGVLCRFEDKTEGVQGFYLRGQIFLMVQVR